MTVKELLARQLEQAYEFDEMSLLTSVHAWKWDQESLSEVRAPDQDMTEDMAVRDPAYWYQNVVAILDHTADCKIMYIDQAFGEPSTAYPAKDGTLAGSLRRLDAAQKRILACLESVPDDKLGEAAPTTWHGETMANLFWFFAQHDVCHGSQIDVLRDEFKTRDRQAARENRSRQA